MKWTVSDTGLVSANDEGGPAPDEVHFEVGDWHSFASLTDSKGAQMEHEVSDRFDSGFESLHRVALNTGVAELKRQERFGGDRIDRKLTLTTPESFEIGDLVGRFVFHKEKDAVVSIAGREIPHRGLNRYYQHRTESATIKNVDGQFTVSVVDSTLPSGMKLFVYARDEPPDSWVIHVRALSEHSDAGMLRLFHLPVTHLRLLDRAVESCTLLKKNLRYIRERSNIDSRWIPFQYVERTRLNPSDTVQIEMSGEYND